MIRTRGANVPCYPLARDGTITTLGHFERAYDDPRSHNLRGRPAANIALGGGG